ncbi:D-lyxose/D-mannose family sugar isomerase [Rhodobacter capsulatus]|nr:D-lyxose/D-mannose family sugar isomerase [Rhodobacter capsulatus]KQB15105.1 hypothetical protein AP071_14615 [Rhodobacter capsulatus]KQB16823.1 hypothetical protein AP073_09330 [Rhodobacter capsulatus]PZX23606.1 hypothetical protein LY44_02230 [Rhodobacter capsulatus]QNR62438.1 D-lyxose/D-mannose family sugar isomerase [Rhodobacter capsulatus]
MKRSEINTILRQSEAFLRGFGQILPPFAHWSPRAEIDGIASDGVTKCLPAGGILRLAPGESVTLMPGNRHAFRGEGGDVLIGEVSTVNDDRTDNIFRDPIGRFADIEEDEDRQHLLVSDDETWRS